MTADEALLAFLRGSLGEKRARILDFASRPRARSKFIGMLYHELVSYFRDDSIVRQLPAEAWNQPGFRFRPPLEVGVPVATLRVAYGENEPGELVITADGRYGYWRDETYADLETLVIADVARSRIP